MSADNGRLLFKASTGALYFHPTSGSLLYAAAPREVEATISSSSTWLTGALPTYYMPYGSDAYDARDYIANHATVSTINWNQSWTGSSAISKFAFGLNRQYDPDIGDYLNGADGYYAFRCVKVTLTTRLPIEITRVQIGVTTYTNRIPIDIAFNFSATQDLTPSQIAALPAYTLQTGNSLDIGLAIPSGTTAFWAYIWAHNFDMAEPEHSYASSNTTGLTNAALQRLWYTDGPQPTP